MKLKVDFLSRGLLTLILAIAISSFTFAQRTITGTITDAENGEALISATVVEVGTSNGTITDFDGNYSLAVSSDATQLEISYTGYGTQTVNIGNLSVVDATLAAGTILDEIVVTGYGTQKEKEITSSVVEVGAEEFNQGVISDPAQLLQGKVAGLQVYNRGGNPNQKATIRLRGLSTVGANQEPLVVVDGVIGASLENVDPNDIDNISVLKDGSAAAIYGSRGSSGVIIVTTKKGAKSQDIKWSYNGQVSTESPVSTVATLSPAEFVAAGGTDLGSQTDWIDEVTENPISHNHGLSVSGGIGNNSSFRASVNLREKNGILRNTGFDQLNTRLNFSSTAFNDKLKIDFSTSITQREQQNGYDEALRYAILYNPTAPILGADAPFVFNGAQFGGFFETLGLFDSFNPVSIMSQNRNETDRKEFNYSANFGYSISDALTVNFRIAQQQTDISNNQYAPTTALFRGNASSPIRKGLAEFYESNSNFSLYEIFGTYLTDLGDKSNLRITGGYSYQQDNFDDKFFSLGDFPNNDLDFSNSIETSQDLQNAGLIGANSNASPDNKIIAFFGRANFTFDDAIFVNASIRREGSSKLGRDNQWGWFPAIGVGVDLNRYLGVESLDLFKVRLGYGVTGALPGPSGLGQEIRSVFNDGQTGAVSTSLQRAANPDLKWEEKAEINLGVEVASGKFSATLDLYNRDISDFILQRTVDAAVFGVDKRFENAGKLNTKGIELALNYDVVQNSDFNYTTGIVLSTYKTTLEEYILEAETRANLGAPGQNGTNMILVRPGDEIGNIWGPVFTGVSEGAPVFADVNGDGNLVTAQDKALDPDVDFEVLGNGVPDLELGWSNRLEFGDWSVNAFFRGAFGHSLVNTFRAFYEPRIASQSSYNFVNTSLAEDGLTTAQFSSLYVEKADFFKLDNLTIARRININNSNFRSATISLTATNPIVITNYTGADPEPSLVDKGAAGNGSLINPNNADPLSPGIDRRNNYFAARSVILGVNLNF